MDSCHAPARGRRRGSAAGSCQVSMIPTVSGSGPGFSTHHSKTPTGRALDSRSPAMTGLELLADEADAEDARARTSATPAGTARGTCRRPRAASSPRRAATSGRSVDRTVAGPAAARPPDEDREAVRGDRREAVPPDLEMPAREVAAVRPPDAPRPEPADRDPGPRAVVDHRQVDPRMAGLGAGQAHRPAPGDGRDVRPGRPRASLVDPGHDDAAHERPLGQEEDDDRHGHRHQRGRLDERRLGRVQRVVLLDADRQRLQLRLARRGTAAARRSRSRRRRSGTG